MKTKWRLRWGRIILTLILVIVIIFLAIGFVRRDYFSKIFSVMNSKYFIFNRLDRYMNYDSEDIDSIIRDVNSNLDYDYYTNIKGTDVSKGELMLVNKYYILESGFHHGKLVTISSNYDNKKGSRLNEDAYGAFRKLVDAAGKKGYNIRSNSAYRSYSYQDGLYSNYKKNNGLTWADKWSARAGHSEHQTGLALDVGVKSDHSLGSFEYSKEFTWMRDNSYKYGFILRYPKDKQEITGYGYEPWHYRYVGVKAARYIYENDITFEEYYAYYVEKK